MNFVDRSRLNNPEWEKWNQRARAAADKLRGVVAGGGQPTINDDIYKAAKPFLSELTNGRCFYCEAMITTEPGHVEHFRPKGRIKDGEGKIVTTITASGQVEEHPGYWWLAYEWTNLLLACTDCNSRRWHGNELAGKNEFFPVRGRRAERPGEEAQEEPLLLNPTLPNQDPSGHLDFMDNGMVKPKTDIGVETCRLLGLNIREPLVTRRTKRIEDVRKALEDLLKYIGLAMWQKAERTQRELDVRHELNEMWEGKTEYGACARSALRRAADMCAENGAPVQFPLDESKRSAATS